MKILITGASGFLAKRILFLWINKKDVTLTTTSRNPSTDPEINQFHIKYINRFTDWSDALTGQDVVIHCAGIAHQANIKTFSENQSYDEVNYEGSVNLANQAAKAGVRRFIYISSIKVNGESTNINHAFKPSDIPEPKDEYGKSKLKAEQYLLELGKKTLMDIVIIRPPMIYGIGVKGNFPRLVSLVKSGFPLPFKSIKNKRSLVYVDNVIDLIDRCCIHPKAIGEVLFVSDNKDVSLPELVTAIANTHNVTLRMISIPPLLMHIFFLAIGKKKLYAKLSASLVLDTYKTKKLLGWTPPYTLQQGLDRLENDT
ncbi:NAD-dependent epimerase/dehydratase family protein [Amylibacter sp.]|nr:NAD-dependent epimerase/dehydratase family protein [Amylibacter sp.]